MSQPTVNTTTTTRKLAERFIERAQELGYKGKKRDDAALDYFVGAAVMAELQDNQPLSQHLGRIAFYLISVRGFIGVKELTIDHPNAKHAADDGRISSLKGI